MSDFTSGLKTIKFHSEKNVGYLKLHRPEVKNAMNPQMFHEISQVLQSVSKDPQVRVLVISGEGSSFCAGADLQWMQSQKDASLQENLADAQNLRMFFHSLQSLGKPLVTVGSGAVFGGGLGLLAVSDWVVLEEKTQLCFSEVLLGIAPAVISEFVLQKIPKSLVAPFMISGKIFSASDALKMGLAQDVCLQEELVDRVVSIVEQFLKTAPFAFSKSKALLQLPVDSLLGGKITTELISQLRVGPEGQEGLRAFLEKRSPAWRKKQ